MNAVGLECTYMIIRNLNVNTILVSIKIVDAVGLDVKVVYWVIRNLIVNTILVSIKIVDAVGLDVRADDYFIIINSLFHFKA